MATTRRKFIKTGALAGAASLIPGTGKLIAAPIPEYKLSAKPEPKSWSNNDLTIAWIGHSTMLINMFGKWILTDPVFFQRIGVYLLGTSIGPSRMTPPALSVNEIPKPDIILLSHGHMDHSDYPSCKAFAELYPGDIDVVVSYLNKDIVEDLPWNSLTMLDWQQSAKVNDTQITALEVEHFGWRFPWEKDRSRGFFLEGRSYNAYLIEFNGIQILFGGDTRFTKKLNILKSENIHTAMMPIGAYNPWKHAHCNPEEALQMADEFNAEYILPMHTMTFQQSSEPFHEPIEWIKKSASNYSPKLGLTNIGETFSPV